MKRRPELRELIWVAVSFLCGAILWYIVRKVDWFETVIDSSSLYILLTKSILHGAEYMLQSIGFHSFVNGEVVKVMGAKHGVRIVYGCLAISHMTLIFGLLIAFPGNWKTKLWYIPAALISVQLLNMFRVAVFALALRFTPDYAEFAHYYVTRGAIYLGILIIWIIFIERFSAYASPRSGIAGAS